MDSKVIDQLIDDAGLSAQTSAIHKLYNHLINQKIITSPSQIKLTSSSGSSVVVLLNNKDHDRVYQCYFNRATYNQICQMMDIAKKNAQQSIDYSMVTIRPRTEVKFNIEYNFNDYRVCALEYWPLLQTIVWEKIIPITQISTDYIKKHIDQLIWDFMKAINGFHQIGYVHADCGFDNIGLKNGRFVLFDYNLSHLAEDKDQYKHDYYLFKKSCLYNIPTESDKIPSNFHDYKYFLLTLKNHSQPTYNQIIEKLEKNERTLVPL